MTAPFLHLAFQALLLLLLGLPSIASASASNYNISTSLLPVATPSASTSLLPVTTPSAVPYWLADIKHQGLAPFAAQGYQVFRNVKDFGAKGASALLPLILGAVSKLTFC
jgi:hypothetical protein